MNKGKVATFTNHLFLSGYSDYFTLMMLKMYRIAGNIDGDLNLAVWRSGKRPSNLNPSNFVCAHIICTLGRPPATFKSANIFVWAAQDQTTKFKDRQYFRLYGILYCIIPKVRL